MTEERLPKGVTRSYDTLGYQKESPRVRVFAISEGKGKYRLHVYTWEFRNFGLPTGTEDIGYAHNARDAQSKLLRYLEKIK